MVPLAEAWDSGASAWDPDRRMRYANDLGSERSLVAVTASENRRKGDKDPSQWMPSAASAQCTYLADWTATKLRWKLSAEGTGRPGKALHRLPQHRREVQARRLTSPQARHPHRIRITVSVPCRPDPASTSTTRPVSTRVYASPPARRSPSTAAAPRASLTRAARTGSRRADTLTGPPSSPTARTRWCGLSRGPVNPITWASTVSACHW